MGTVRRIGAVMALWALCASLPACGGETGPFAQVELDAILTKLGPLPDQRMPDPTNAFADNLRAAALGHSLFYEKRYSSSGTVACATCHDPDSGFQDTRINTSLGLDATDRHTPTVLNAAIGNADPEATRWHFWDGRVDSQWSQALGPPENDVEMGSSRTRIALLIYDEYRAEYEVVFGPMPMMRIGDTPRFPPSARPGTAEWAALDPSDQDAITLVYVNFGKAIAAFERQLVSTNSRFDRFWEELAIGSLDSPFLTGLEKDGLRLFIGKAGCLECHHGPTFSDGLFHNIGLSQDGPFLRADDPGREGGIGIVVAGEFNCASRWSDEPTKSACEVNAISAGAADLGAFKTAGLRTASLTAPYMHTGLFDTLADVVEHYDSGGAPGGFVGQIDDKLQQLNLTRLEINALVAFVEALEGEALDPALLAPP